MAYNLGEAYLRVFPNMEKFHTELKKKEEWQKAKNEQIEIPVRLDLDEFNRDIEVVDKKIHSYDNKGIDIKVDVDSVSALSELKAIEKTADDLDGKVVEIKVVVDDNQARRRLNDLHQTAQDNPIEISTELNSRDLDLIERDLERLKSDNETLDVFVAVNRNYADDEMDDFRKKHEQIAIKQRVEMVQPMKMPSFGGGMGAEAREMIKVANGAIARQWTAVSLVPDILSKMNEQLDAGINQIYTPYLRMVKNVYDYAAKPFRNFRDMFNQAKTLGEFTGMLRDRFKEFGEKALNAGINAGAAFENISESIRKMPNLTKRATDDIRLRFMYAGQSAAAAMARSADDIRLRLMYLGESARKNMEPIKKQMTAASGALSVALLGSANRFSKSVSGVGSSLSRTFSGIGTTLSESMSDLGTGVSSRLTNGFRDAAAAGILHLGVLDRETDGMLSRMAGRFQAFSNKARSSLAGVALAANINFQTMLRSAQQVSGKITDSFANFRSRVGDAFDSVRGQAVTSFRNMAAAGLLHLGVLNAETGGMLSGIVNGFRQLPGRITGGFRGLRDGVTNAFRDAVAGGILHLGVLNAETDGALGRIVRSFRSLGGNISSVFSSALGSVRQFNSRTLGEMNHVWSAAIGDVNRFGGAIKRSFGSIASGGSMKLAFTEIQRGIKSATDSVSSAIGGINRRVIDFRLNTMVAFDEVSRGIRSKLGRALGDGGTYLGVMASEMSSKAGRIFGPVGRKLSQHMAKGMADKAAWKGVQVVFRRLNSYIAGFSRIAVGAFAKVGGVIMKSLLPALGAAAAGIALMAGQVAIVGIMALANALFSVAQGAALMAPALIAAAGISFAALKIGLEGVQEAVSSAFSAETAEEFEEAISGLPASVQAIARSFREFKPAVDEMKTAVQDNLLSGLAPGISAAMTNLFPTISTGLQNIATEWNGALKMALDELATDESQRGLSIIMENTTEAARNMQPVIANLMNAFGALAEMGSNHLPAIGNWATEISEKFKDWVASLREIDESTGMSKFDTMIQSAVENAKLLGAIFGGLFGTIRNVASAMGEGGGGMMAGWAASMQALNESTKEGTDNYKAMVQFARDANGAASQLGDILSPAFGIIASIASTLMRVASAAIPGIASALESLKVGLEPLESVATGFGESLGNAIGALGPALSRIGDVLAPLFSGIASGIEALFVTAGPAIESLIAALAPVAEALIPVFESAGSAIGEIFVSLEPILSSSFSIMESMGPALSSIFEWFGKIIGAAADLLAPLLTAHDEGIKRILEGIGPIVDALGNGIMKVFDILAPYMPMVSAALGLIVDAIAAIMPFIPPIIDFVMNVLSHAINFLLPIAGVVLGIVAAFKAYTVIMGVFNTVMGVARGIMTAVRIATVLFNLALAANPIGLIITAVIALVGALIYFFTQTELGGKIWSSIMDGLKAAWNWVVEAIQWGWENIIKPVWDAISLAARVLFAVISTVLITPFVIAWNLLSTGIQWAWENIIKPAWDALSAGASWLWENVLQPVFQYISDKWTWLSGMIEIGALLIQRYWDLLKFKLQEFWEMYVTPILTAISDKWNWLKDKIGEGWQAIRDNVITPFMNFIQMLWDSYVRPRIDNIMDKWESMRAALSSVWDRIRDGIIQPFMDKLTDLKNWFGDTVENIGKLWDQLKQKMASPINWAIKHVFNGGIRPAWNAVAGLVNLGELDKMDEIAFARGGVLPGYTPGRDVHQFVSPTGGKLHLSGGEAIMRPEWTRAVGGPAAVEQMNRAARNGSLSKPGRTRRKDEEMRNIKAAHRHADGGVLPMLGAFANGGVVEAMTRIVQEKYPGMVMTSGWRNSNDNHGRGLAADFAWPGAFGPHPAQLSLANDIADTYPGSMELIYGPGFSRQIKNGSIVGDGGGNYGFYAGAGDHSNHVHWAMNTPPTLSFGGGVFEGGSDGGGGGGGGFWQAITGTVKRLWDAVIDAVPSFPDADAFGTFGQVPGNWLKEAAGAAWDHIKSLADNIKEWVGGGGGANLDLSGVAGTNLEIGQQLAEKVGWVGSEWEALKTLWTNESGWDNNAQNPTSTAYGIPQFLDTTWATVGYEKTSDPATQIAAGIKYIQQRPDYDGKPSRALALWQSRSPHWYDQGGEAAGTGFMEKRTLHPERVLSPSQTRAFNDFIYGFLPTMIEDYRRRPYDINTAVDKLITGWNGIQKDADKRRDLRIDRMSEGLKSTFEARENGTLKTNPIDLQMDRGWVDRNGDKLAANLSRAVSGAQMVSIDPWGYLEAEERAKERIEAEKDKAREDAKAEREEADKKAQEEEDKARQEKEQAELDAAETEEEKEKIREEHEAAREERQAAQQERDQAQQERDQAEEDRIQAAKESGEYYYGYKVFGEGASNPNAYEASEHEKEVLNYLDALAAPLGIDGPVNKVQEKLPVFQELGAAVQTATPAWMAALNGDPSGLQHNIAVSQAAAYEQREAELRDLGPSALAGVLEMAMSTSALNSQQPFIGEVHHHGLSEAEFAKRMDYLQAKQARQKSGTMRTR